MYWGSLSHSVPILRMGLSRICFNGDVAMEHGNPLTTITMVIVVITTID